MPARKDVWYAEFLTLKIWAMGAFLNQGYSLNDKKNSRLFAKSQTPKREIPITSAFFEVFLLGFFNFVGRAEGFTQPCRIVQHTSLTLLASFFDIVFLMS
jgi:hypothetical protein